MKPLKEVYYRQKKDLLHIFEQALSATRPYNLVQEKVSADDNFIAVGEKKYPVNKHQKIWVIGSGKASAQMALALEERLGDRIYDGLVVCPSGAKTSTRYIRQIEADHPIPGKASVEAADEMVSLVDKINADDLVIYLMSGGSSALLCMPPEEITLESIQKMNQALLNSGANIGEMNTVRKHLSLIKGGQLAFKLKAANLIALVISDVPGDHPEDIGSGLLVPDPSTFDDTMQVLQKYNIQTSLPREVLHYIQEGIEGRVPETLKESIEKHDYILLGNARYAARQASITAKELGYSVHMANEAYSGETHTISKEMCRSALSVLDQDKPVAKPAALIYYGESYVNVTGSGKGGRNQELALAAALELQEHHYISMLSAGTDGRDGPTDAAGAISTGNTAKIARKAGLGPEEFLNNHDSYHFFEAVNGLIKTGDTGNNVMDLQIILVED
ncbi:MAG: DUF4147 domain-containing protein [Balneolales bacterium]